MNLNIKPKEKLNKEKQKLHIKHHTYNNKGITLIALIITIVILLILAVVAINAVQGDGIITKAKTARDKTNIANVKEMAQVDILGYQAENQNGEITTKQLKEVLSKYFKDVPDEGQLKEKLKDPDYSLKVKKEYGGDSIEVKLSDIYDGELGDGMLADELTEPVAEATRSYVGYYADIDGNGSVDGIIYADLAVGGEGRWNSDSWSNYEYTAETEGLKTYTIGAEVESDKFGTAKKPVISAVKNSSGKDRFYVMALEDVDSNTHYWYNSAYGKLNDTVATSANDFGKGKENTKKMIDNWNKNGGEGSYGTQNDNDLWGIIQKKEINTKYSDLETWFVPSKSEWSAFGDMLFKSEAKGGFGATKSTYSKFGLKSLYWSSSQWSASDAYYAIFYSGCFSNCRINDSRPVRLSATF